MLKRGIKGESHTNHVKALGQGKIFFCDRALSAPSRAVIESQRKRALMNARHTDRRLEPNSNGP